MLQLHEGNSETCRCWLCVRRREYSQRVHVWLQQYLEEIRRSEILTAKDYNWRANALPYY